MKKQLYFTALLMLAVILSAGVVCASDVSVTDSYVASLIDDTEVISIYNGDDAGSSEILASCVSNVDNDTSKVSLSSVEVLESDNSNILSTNTNDNSAKGITYNAAYSDDAVLSKSSSSDISGSAIMSSTNNGDAKLAADSSSKTTTTLTATDVTVNYGADGYLVATLKDGNGKAIKGAKVGFANNGVKYVLTDANGQAKYSTKDLAVGTYTVKMKFYGDNAYNASNQAITKVVVNKAATRLTSANVNVNYSSDGYLVATLKDAENNAIKGAKVGFANNGVKYFVTDANGQAKYSTKDLAAGTYTVKMAFYGSDSYLASNQVSARINVNKLYTTLTTANINVNYGSSNYLVATLKDGNGKAIKGAKVGFANNGVKYVLTDANGQAKYSTKDLAVGTYTVKMAFYGSDSYLASNQAIAKVVVNKASTTLTVSDVTVNYGADGYLVATLKDGNGKAIKGAKVGFANNGVKYVLTDANGQAKYSTKDLAAGTYNVKIKFYGDNTYLASNQVTAKIVVNEKANPKNGNGYFVFGGDMNDVNLNTLASNGVTVLFLNYYAVEKYGQSAVETWIASANKVGIKVHIWMQAFYEDGKWVNPVMGGSYNNGYSNHKITEAQHYAKIKGVSGILLDYLRYPGTAYNTAGGTDAISKFTKLITDEVHKINSALIVSAAIMPETTSSAYYYGQDYSAISSTVDVVMPMIYKGNYGKSTSWIKTTTKWYVDNSKGAKVWAVVQSYKSDDDVTKLSVSELTTDVKNAISGGSDGAVIFRYGITNFINFNKLDDSSSSSSTSSGPASISINDILTGANNLKAYYEKNKALPKTVTAAGHAFTLPEFLYLMNQAIYQLGNSNTAAIKCIYGVKDPSSPSGDAINTQLSRTNYLAVAKKVADYIKTNNKAPNYSSSAVGKIMYSDLVDISSRILAFYKNNDKYMPNYVTIKTNGGSSSSSSSSSSTTGPTSISINDILTGSTNLKNYIASNGVLPNTVTAAGHAFTLPEFLYLMSQATYQLGNSNTTAIKCIYGVKAASSSSGDTISAQLVKNDYLTLGKNVANYIKTNNQAPNYASSAVGKISYNGLADAFSRILAFYKNNDNYMPNYVTITQGSGSSSSSYTTGGMNVKNTITNLDPYYKSTTNCQVNNPAIKNIVNSLTSGLTSDKEKATVIYNYVRDQVSYSFYYDTKYGAVGTLNAKTGNCVDQAHLLVAMYRTAGLAARYEHGTCYFTLSGSTYGHVWTQVLIDNVWVVGDPTSTRNSFGNVVNWNTNSYTHKAYYASLPF